MTDRGIEIIQKRMDLCNLLDQAVAKQKDLKFLNEEIEKKTKELQLLETALKVDRAAEELNKYLKDDKGHNDPKTWSRSRLKRTYHDMSNEEIDLLYDRIHVE